MNSTAKSLLAGSLVFLVGALAVAPWAEAQTNPKQTQFSRVFETHEGRGILTLDLQTLDQAEIRLVDRDGRFEGVDQAELGFALPADSHLELARLNRYFAVFVGGSTDLEGRIDFTGPNQTRFAVRDATLVAEEDTGGTVWSLISQDVEVLRFVSSSLVEMDYGNGRMRWEEVDVMLGAGLTERLGRPSAEGTLVGKLALEARIVPTDRNAGDEAIEGHPVAEGNVDTVGAIGPDVIVGALPDTANWGVVGSIRAYSVGTTSCNIGDENLDWIANTNRHPVIGQNLYRLKDGKLEMIGQSWLKHGFFALSGGLCFNDCQGTDGSELGVHCSDPYSSGLNGSQSGLGPKSEVNATTGAYPYPPTRPGSSNRILGRLQVHVNDVDPALNVGANYYVEGHYITPDDAAAGNGLNNASYRRTLISGANRSLALTGATFQQQPAINAWKAADASVTQSTMDIPGDGRFHVSSKATDLGNGTWNYEFAVFNLNSHRSGQAFSVRFPPGSNISNIGFHDVDHHSGEPYSGADWQATVNVDSITWSTQTFAQNQNANALRWGTLYNFRFDCDCPPFTGEATLTAFRPGVDNDFVVTAEVPMVDPPEPMADLSVETMFVDYDPSTGPINNGPGAIGQELGVLVRVRNRGNVSITSADVSLMANVAGGSVISKNVVITDFGTDPGNQPLDPNRNHDVFFVFAAGELDRCGTYTLIASHDGPSLMATSGAGPIVGDSNSANDAREDYPDDQNNPDDDQSPDLLELRFGTINTRVLNESVIIENPATERLKLNIVYMGLGPGNDSHDVQLTIDLMNPSGSTVLHPNIFSVSRMGIRSSGNRTVVLRVPVNTIPAGEYRVRMTLSDTNSSEGCLTASTSNTTTIQ